MQQATHAALCRWAARCGAGAAGAAPLASERAGGSVVEARSVQGPAHAPKPNRQALKPVAAQPSAPPAAMPRRAKEGKGGGGGGGGAGGAAAAVSTVRDAPPPPTTPATRGAPSMAARVEVEDSM